MLLFYKLHKKVVGIYLFSIHIFQVFKYVYDMFDLKIHSKMNFQIEHIILTQPVNIKFTLMNLEFWKCACKHLI